MPSVFWMFILAHLIADYPLQTDWLVSVKRTWWGLALHVGVHLAVLLVMAGPALPQLWLYAVGLAAIHYCIDYFKNWLSSVRPRWINGSYIFDQFLHLLSLIGVTLWIGFTLPTETTLPALLLPADWTALLIGLCFCTVVWYISERVLTHATPAYRREVIVRRWPRIIVRASLFFVLLRLSESAGLYLLPLALLPYPSADFRRRAALTDVAVAGVAALLTLSAG